MHVEAKRPAIMRCFFKGKKTLEKRFYGFFSVQAEKGGLRISRNSLSTVSFFTQKVCIKAKCCNKEKFCLITISCHCDCLQKKRTLKTSNCNILNNQLLILSSVAFRESITPPKPVPSPVVKGGGGVSEKDLVPVRNSIRNIFEMELAVKIFISGRAVLHNKQFSLHFNYNMER
ncbi:hypothetical protein T02_10955 [Trichinella nativa]|uniref:Uncharacterized protein n=1 Tax=Trichinella nativa TaxID=6335 RepID=A0A0V1LFP5_9BILA|nr:hypothetical protein T02_10955 [Trichinella nativa]